MSSNMVSHAPEAIQPQAQPGKHKTGNGRTQPGQFVLHIDQPIISEIGRPAPLSWLLSR
jgi:hypothetical protein